MCLRKEIKLSDSVIDLMTLMSEGNPGALNVLMQLKNPMNILNLDDMNIRGAQIWVGFKDYCDSNIDKFEICISARNANMILKINEEGFRGNHKHKAVKYGASYNNRELLQ